MIENTEQLSHKLKDFLITLRDEFKEIIIKIREINSALNKSSLKEIEQKLSEKIRIIKNFITVLNVFNL